MRLVQCYIVNVGITWFISLFVLTIVVCVHIDNIFSVPSLLSFNVTTEVLYGARDCVANGVAAF